MDSVFDILLDTVISLLILAIGICYFFGFLGELLYEDFGFGTLQEKSSQFVEYEIDIGPHDSFTQAQYYMLPIVDKQEERVIYEIDSENTYQYSSKTSDNKLTSVYQKVMDVVAHTEYTGNLEKAQYYITINSEGTVIFKRGGVN